MKELMEYPDLTSCPDTVGKTSVKRLQPSLEEAND